MENYFPYFCQMLQLSSVSKWYGKQKAVDQLSFSAGPGEITGFLGPNGAGKSTAMKLITGYLSPSEGSISIGGMDVQKAPLKTKQKVGYLPEQNPLYPDMYVREYLHFMGKLHRVKNLKPRIEEMIAVCGLTAEQHKLIGTLSKGYRQRVGLAQALLHNPEVLILDEPTSGLDPNQIIEIRKVIKSVSRHKTVLLSSHIMQEVEAICDRIIILHRGKMVANDRVKNLTQNQSLEDIFHSLTQN